MHKANTRRKGGGSLILWGVKRNVWNMLKRDKPSVSKRFKVRGLLSAPQTFSCTSNNYSFDSNQKYETDFEIRFINIHVFLWNGFRNPFQKSMKRILKSVSQKKKIVKRISESVSEKYETDFKFHFRKVWNGFQNPFLEKKIKICETDFGIRFILFWNGFWNLFHKKKIKICETDIEICSRKIWNGFRNPFLKKN